MEGGSAGNSNGRAGANPLREMYDEWTYKTPFVTRNSLIWIILMSDFFFSPSHAPLSVRYLLSFFLSMDSIFGNIPFFTLYQFEIYRIFFASLVGNSFLTLLMICLFYPAMGTRLENSLVSLLVFTFPSSSLTSSSSLSSLSTP
jgi:hypothetical protein